MPYLQIVIDFCQLGFLRDRNPNVHIETLNDFFYSAIRDNTHAYHILFLDTQKAFDSIDHNFIFAAIERLGLPHWFSLAVAGLLSDVEVSPVFDRRTFDTIPILRGVKQGCPLSPLLFAICYDALISRLSLNLGLSVHAMAET